MELNDCGVALVDICVVRGDNRTLRFTVKDRSGAVLPPGSLFGVAAKLAVDPNPDPDDATTKVLELIGSVNDTDSQVEFTPDESQAIALAPDVYFYDMQLTFPGDITVTSAKGQFTVEADISDAGA